jgi:MFS family permease
VSATSNDDRIDAFVWRISAVVIIGSIMSILDTTIVNVDLHTSIAGIQWVTTGYMLSLAAVIPITGWAARRFGAKQVYLVSLVLFTAGSALCGLATGITTLAVIPCVILMRAERAARRSEEDVGAPGEETLAEAVAA